MRVGFKRLTEDAVLPSKAHASDSGFDLVASADVIVEPGATVVVPTGIAVQLPVGFEAQVRPRSGVTSRTNLRVALGTIDQGYGGEIGVICDNIAQKEHDATYGYYVGYLDGSISDDPEYLLGSYLIRKGDRIAQLVITRLPSVEDVEVFDVEDTARGSHGFGSSGVTVNAQA
ncbi:deoxyuridine 5'-triphosphate nucleotidohydrolase [Sporosarcina sp. ACRSL]|uniref:dUTP diphosphatase n=1 Tax=Sporosarcina sp. ACRSL TaxID=2918215 RepID=UPI001EF6D943|nr:deoxyuridine 5'-triphosphate nucleotidohydrolase [Sporosarcina sp. ACRSL]